MPEARDWFLDWQRWGAFRIPAVGVIVLTIILLAGSWNNLEDAPFVQKLTIWVLGSGVISYGHSLAHSTQKNWQGSDFKDLRPRAQAIAVAVHAAWLSAFIYLIYVV